MTRPQFSACDAPASRPVYIIGEVNGEPVFGCRCLVCGRCGHHTGNSTQGHYWRFCKVTGQMEEFHSCCPGDCELHPAAEGAAR